LLYTCIVHKHNTQSETFHEFKLSTWFVSIGSAQVNSYDIEEDK